MPGKYDGEGVKMDSFVLLPEGEYTLRIIDVAQSYTKVQDDMITVGYEVVGGEYNLEKVPYFRVIFFKDRAHKGAGMALKFLKSIGEPYEGQFQWNEKNWVGKKLKGTIKHEVATMGKHAGKTFAKVAWVDSCDDVPGGIPAEEVPF